MILGHNIEMCLTAPNGFLSERLRNPKFTGPPHRMTGIAPQWQGASYGRASYELTPGGGLRGEEAQLVIAKGAGAAQHLHQNKLHVRAGEQLELEIWARAWHDAVKLTVSLHPVASRAPAYDEAEIVVDAPYFKRYTASLTARHDDDEARLAINLLQGGELWFDQIHLRPKGEPLLCQELVDQMEQMRIPTLRFPGGIIVNAYHWKHATGPVHLRPSRLDAAFHHDWELNYDFGLDEYLELTLGQGITPALTLNVATGTPDDAAQCAAYCAAWYRDAGAECPPIYWHIANHPYIDTTAHMTPAMYAEVVRTFVPRVRDHYPTCRIVGVLPRESLTGAGAPAEWKQALFTVADLVDVVQFQQYGGGDPTADPARQLADLAQGLTAFEDDVRAFIAECRSRGVTWRVGVAEWNRWQQASHWDGRGFDEPPTVLHGLFVAGMLHRFAGLAPDLEVAHFYNLVNCMGILNRRGLDVEVTDSVRAFGLYRPAFPGTLIDVDLEGVDDVDALCLQGADADWLFLVNRTGDAVEGAALKGFDLAGAEFEGLAGTQTIGTFDDFEVRCADARIDLPALSITRIRMPH